MNYHCLCMFIGGTCVGSFLTWSYMNYKTLKKINYQTGKFEDTLLRIGNQLTKCENITPENIKKTVIDIVEASVSELFNKLQEISHGNHNQTVGTDIFSYYMMLLLNQNHTSKRNSAK